MVNLTLRQKQVLDFLIRADSRPVGDRRKAYFRGQADGGGGQQKGEMSK